MWFGLPAEIAVRCEHCGENDRRTPVELKSGRLACFMCSQVSALSPAVSAVEAGPVRTAASAAFEIARRLATLQPPTGNASRDEDCPANDALPLIDPEPKTR